MGVRRAHVPKLPGKSKTGVDDYQRKKGVKATKKMLQEAAKTPLIGGPISIEIENLKETDMQRIDYLWEPYIPKAVLSGVKGDPGGGKTFVALSIAAALSQGKIPASEDQMCEPVNTLYCRYENDAARVVKPRFIAMGGEPSRLFTLTGVKGSDGKPRAFTLADAEAIKQAIEKCKAQFVVFDPLQSFLGAGVDMHRANETRPILDGLAKVAEETDAAIWIVRHMAKSSRGRSVHSGLGTIDIVGALRTEVLVGCAPDDRNHCAFIHDKPGICRRGASLRFEIESTTVKDADNTSINTARVVWKGTSYLTASDLSAPEDTTRHMTKDAKTWLRDQLANGARLVSELVIEWTSASGQKPENAERMLQRAAKGINVLKTRRGKGGVVEWALGPQRKFEPQRANTQ